MQRVTGERPASSSPYFSCSCSAVFLLTFFFVGLQLFLDRPILRLGFVEGGPELVQGETRLRGIRVPMSGPSVFFSPSFRFLFSTPSSLSRRLRFSRLPSAASNPSEPKPTLSFGLSSQSSRVSLTRPSFFWPPLADWLAFPRSFLSFIGFFAAIAYHTPYAQPWIVPPVALYTFDLFARLFKTRIKDAVLVPLTESTLVRPPPLLSV